MSSLFQSFEFLNRGWDIRLLEAQSVRSVFVFLMVDVFILGILTFMLVSSIYRVQRLNWTTAILIVIFILSVFRYSSVIYRRL